MVFLYLSGLRCPLTESKMTRFGRANLFGSDLAAVRLNYQFFIHLNEKCCLLRGVALLLLWSVHILYRESDILDKYQYTE